MLAQMYRGRNKNVLLEHNCSCSFLSVIIISLVILAIVIFNVIMILTYFRMQVHGKKSCTVYAHMYLVVAAQIPSCLN